MFPLIQECADDLTVKQVEEINKKIDEIIKKTSLNVAEKWYDSCTSASIIVFSCCWVIFIQQLLNLFPQLECCDRQVQHGCIQHLSSTSSRGSVAVTQGISFSGLLNCYSSLVFHCINSYSFDSKLFLLSIFSPG